MGERRCGAFLGFFRIVFSVRRPVEENVLTEVPSGENAEAEKGGKFGNARGDLFF